MNFKLYTLLGLLVCCMLGCQPDKLDQLDQEIDALLREASDGRGPSFFQLPPANDFADIPQDPNNPLTSEKIRLGQLLFHEPGLGVRAMQVEGMTTFSCATCHLAEAGFQAGRQQGIGEGGVGMGERGEGRQLDLRYDTELMDVQSIRTPSVLNTAYQEVMMWNGQFGATGMNIGTHDAWEPGTALAANELGYQGLESQAIGNMDIHRLDIDPTFLHEAGYKNLYDAAFPDWPEEERYSKTTTGLAIAAYERTLLPNQSPWQRYLRGNLQLMDDQEKRGAILFFGKADCVSCHTGPALNSMSFHALGMADLDECIDEVINGDAADNVNLGRGGFTGRAWELYTFKTPQLYNLADSPFYGHGSSFRSIRDVVAYKNKAEAESNRMHENRLSEQFVSLGLSEQEIDQITAFLETALYDPNLSRFKPTSLPSGNCFPNNDEVSRQELGCQ